MKHKKIIILVTLGALLCVGKVWADNNSWQGSPNLTRTRNIIDQLGQKLSQNQVKLIGCKNKLALLKVN